MKQQPPRWGRAAFRGPPSHQLHHKPPGAHGPPLPQFPKLQIGHKASSGVAFPQLCCRGGGWRVAWLPGSRTPAVPASLRAGEKVSRGGRSLRAPDLAPRLGWGSCDLGQGGREGDACFSIPPLWAPATARRAKPKGVSSNASPGLWLLGEGWHLPASPAGHAPGAATSRELWWLWPRFGAGILGQGRGEQQRSPGAAPGGCS